MAQGNDGNYLQHCIEVEAAVRLAKMDAKKKRLHIALTHGMAPSEPFEVSLNQPKPGLCRRLLRCKLKESKKPRQSDEPAVVDAYRKTNASEKHYPNSAELLRAIIGTNNLSGGITEIDCEKHRQLAKAWSCSNVKTVCSSWREKIHPEGILACPDDLQTPWLFSMDPMTYRESDSEDDDKLHRCDIDILSRALSRYFSSGNPGIVALLVYGVGKNDNDRQHLFWNFVKDLKELIADNLSGRFEVAASYYSNPYMWGNRNLAGLIHSSQIDLSSNLKSACLELGIEPGRNLAARL